MSPYHKIKYSLFCIEPLKISSEFYTRETLDLRKRSSVKRDTVTCSRYISIGVFVELSPSLRFPRPAYRLTAIRAKLRRSVNTEARGFSDKLISTSPPALCRSVFVYFSRTLCPYCIRILQHWFTCFVKNNLFRVTF